MNIEKYDVKEADERGYRPFAGDYSLPNEQWMVDNVVKDMEQGNVDICFVGKGYKKIEIWRKGGLNIS